MLVAALATSRAAADSGFVLITPRLCVRGARCGLGGACRFSRNACAGLVRGSKPQRRTAQLADLPRRRDCENCPTMSVSVIVLAVAVALGVAMYLGVVDRNLLCFDDASANGLQGPVVLHYFKVILFF